MYKPKQQSNIYKETMPVNKYGYTCNKHFKMAVKRSTCDCPALGKVSTKSEWNGINKYM